MKNKINLLLTFFNFNNKGHLSFYSIRNGKNEILIYKIALFNKLFSFNVNNKLWFEVRINESSLSYNHLVKGAENGNSNYMWRRHDLEIPN